MTLGYLEKEDVKSVVEHVQRHFGKRKIIIWGRSMGAATAILYASKQRGLAALVLDSPFSDLERVIHSLA